MAIQSGSIVRLKSQPLPQMVVEYFYDVTPEVRLARVVWSDGQEYIFRKKIAVAALEEVNPPPEAAQPEPNQP